MQVTSAHERELADGCWLVLTYPDCPQVRIDVTFADQLIAEESAIIITVDNLQVMLDVESPVVAHDLISRLAPFTRHRRVSRYDEYTVVKNRLEDHGVRPVTMLTYAGYDAMVMKDTVYFGDYGLLLEDVSRVAAEGEVVPMPDGHLPAVLVALAVHAARRADHRAVLAQHVMEYEAHLPSSERVPPAQRIEGQAEDGWLILEYRNHPTIRVDVTHIDRITASEERLVLVVSDHRGEVKAELRIAGADNARRLAEQLGPFTRTVAVKQSRVCEALRDRIDSRLSGTVFYGDSGVEVTEDKLVQVHEFAFPLVEALGRAHANAEIDTPNGGLPAGLLALAAFEVERVDHNAVLSRRIAAYEATLS